MELKKTSERVNRTFDADGNATERIDTEEYNIYDGGTSLGSATIGNGYANVRIDVTGLGSANAAKARVAEILGVAAE